MTSKLWIIDDEESIRTICKSALEQDFDIEMFPNASEALLALNTSVPDLIITDIKMPGMNGIDFLNKVSAKHPNIPTIVILRIQTLKMPYLHLKEVHLIICQNHLMLMILEELR